MAFRAPPVLVIILLFSTKGWAQTAADAEPATPPQQQLTVRVTVPTLVGVMSDYAQTLLSRDKNKLKTLTSKRQSRTSNPVIVFTVNLPRGWGPKKRAPSTDKK